MQLTPFRDPMTSPRGIRGQAAAVLATVLFALLATRPPAHAQDAAVATPPCRQVSPTVFMIDGPTDAAMRDCVRATLAAGTNEVVLRSGGGDIEAALDIADLLQRPGLAVRVRDKCYSSCANYFLPLASTLVVEPGATIVVHGGVDPEFIAEGHVARRAEHLRERQRLRPDLSAQQLAADFERSVVEFTALAERQRRFAQRHGVGPGWFLYREPGDGDFGRHLAGRAGPRPGLFGWQYLLVEEPMLRSCLPRVQLQPYQAALEADFIRHRERYARFVKAKGRRSLDLRCVAVEQGAGV